MYKAEFINVRKAFKKFPDWGYKAYIYILKDKLIKG